MKKQQGSSVVREGKLKLLDSETKTWTNVHLSLVMSDDATSEPTFVLLAKQDDKSVSVSVDKSCRFLADAAKVTSVPHTFSISSGDQAVNLVLRAEEAEYKKWTTDIGRAKMTVSGFSTSVSALGFGSLFGRSASKSHVSATSALSTPTSPVNSTAGALAPGAGSSVQGSSSASGSGSGTLPNKAAVARDFAVKVMELSKLEEQLARKRFEVMSMVGLADLDDGSQLMSPSSSRKSLMGPGVGAMRSEAYRQAVLKDLPKRWTVTNEYVASAPGELSLAVGDVVQGWYSSACCVGWGFGLVTQKDGKELSGWFPLSWTKQETDEDSARSRASSTLGNNNNSGPVAEVKKLDLEGFAIKVFNMKAKKGVSWIKEQLYKSADVGSEEDVDASIGHFLWDHRKDLSKAELGDLFGEDTVEAKRIYNAFVSKFNVVGLDLDLALRRLLYLFKLPGEAQKIDRVMQVFSKHYYDANCGENSPLPLVREAIKSPKEAYTLVFALIMLNTDAHTENLPKRMSCQEFLDNIRYSTKEGIFIDNDYLSDMYYRIVNEEIKMQDAARYPFASKKGFLEVRLGPFWVKRWIILSEGKLVICKSVEHEDESQLAVPASSLVVDDSASEPSAALTFAVATPVTKLKFRAKSERDRMQWLEALAKEAQVVAEETSDPTDSESVSGSTSRTELFTTPVARRPSAVTPVDLSSVRRPTLDGTLPASTPSAASSEEPGSALSGTDHVVQAQSKTTPRGNKSPRRRKKKTMTSNTGGKKRRKRDKVVALYDINAPPGSGRISVSAGEVLLLIQRTNQNWYKVQSHAGVSGYIPSSYITPHVSGISSLEPPPQPPMPAEDFTRVVFTPAPTQDAAVLSSLLSPREAPRVNEDDEEDEEKETGDAKTN